MLTQLSQKHEIPMSPNRRFWNEEANPDSLYHIYLKKITYSSNNDLNDSDISDPGGYRRSDRKLKKDETLNGKRITRVDQSEDRRRRSKSVDKNEIQSLQWETRRVRILKAATMDHIIEFILLLTPHQRDSEITASRNHQCTSQMEEERNDVTHIMHVLFCTYRIYCTPIELFSILVKHSPRASPQQIRFLLHYWLRYYPEDYLSPVDGMSIVNSDYNTSCDNKSLPTTTTTTTSKTPTKNSTSSTSESSNSSKTPNKPVNSSSSSIISTSSSSSSSTSSNCITNNTSNCNRRTGKMDNELIGSGKNKSTRSQSSTSSVGSSVSASSQSSSSTTSNQRILLDLLLELPCIDDTLYRKAHLFVEQHKTQLNAENSNSINIKSTTTNGNNATNKTPSYCIIDLDTKFVAQQLTAIDLENFLSLKPYTLLNGHRHNPRVQNMIRNFNLLSKHVVVTILKAHSPDLVTTHWINIAQQLRRMKNFNSLKAVIAGLSNESVFRLKQTVWSKISKTTESTFKHLSTIVDDVDNQTLLRQTQLEIEGTAKVSIEEDSFGTIPYLGTFLTDLTFIDTKSSNYIENAKAGGKKLINLEKCCKQFEIITQIHLLQQNINAALTAFHQSQQLTGLSQLPSYNSTPTVPRIVVARLFRAWFQDSVIAEMTDNDCYKLSLALESSQNQKK